MSVQFDPSSPEFFNNPFPTFARLLADDPVHWNERAQAWFITRYEDVRSAFRDPRLSSLRAHRPQTDLSDEEARNRNAYDYYNSRTLIFQDPPDHTRLRGFLNKAFTPRAIEELRPKIVGIVDGLLEEMAQQSPEQDFVPQFAGALPCAVIAELLGIPREDLPLVKEWSNKFVAINSLNIPNKHRIAGDGMRDMAAYLRDFVPYRRANPGNSITDQLITSMDQPNDHGPVTVDELIANLMVLLIAGHETTANMISCGMLRLLQHPEQLEDFRAGMTNPDCVANAVEEILRYDSPLSNVPRTAVADIELHGKKIQAGQRVYLATLAANHDQTVFTGPDRFDIRRDNAGKHIAFAFGIHFCIGAPLARMEGQIAFPALLRRFPNIRLSDKRPDWADALTLHGLTTLPVVVA